MTPYALPPRTLALALAVLIVPVVLAYSNIFNAEFTLDDIDTILNNPAIKRLWPPSFLQGYLTRYEYFNQILYTRPVSQFSFALNYALGGFTPWGYHAVNLAIHILNTVLVFGIVRRTLLTPLLIQTFGKAALEVALVGALLWGVHPLDTNTITYTSPRMEALMALFYLSTLYCWIHGVQEQSGGWLAISVASSFLGMMSKEVMVTAPLMVFLYDGLFLAGSWRQALRQRWVWYAGLALSMVLLAILILTVPGEHGAFLSNATAANQRGAHSDRWSYAATMPGVILYYLRLIAWPEPLVFDYKWPVAASWTDVVWPGLVLAGVVLIALWGLVRRQPWAYPIVWYLIVLSPSSSLMPLYDDYIAEYRVYLPSIGPIVLVVCMAWLILRKIGGTAHRHAAIGTLAGAILVCGLGGLTWARNTVYRTDLSIWADTVAKAPNNTRAHMGLADALSHRGRYADAIEQYREALHLYPGNLPVRINLGVALAKQGKLAEALDEFREILRTSPNESQPHNNIGVILQQQGHLDQALREFREALRLNPGNAAADKNLRELLAKRGPPKDTTQDYREALRLNPNDARAYFALAAALADQGRDDEAIEAYRDGLRLDPHNSQAHADVGAIYRKQGRLAEAAAAFQSAFQENPADARTAFDLGSVLEQLGKLDEAVAALRTATRLAPQDNNAHTVLAGVLFKQKKLAEAAEEYRQSLRIQPTAVLYNNLGVALALQGDREGSLKAFQQALEIDPKNTDALNNMRTLQGGK